MSEPSVRNRKADGKPAGLSISPRNEQIAYRVVAAAVFVVICAVLFLETILPLPAAQPAEPAAAVIEAEQLMQKRQLREARIKIDAHIRDNPDDALAHAVRGLLRSASGLYAASLDDYTRAVRLDPENLKYRQARADINASIGWMDRARRDYDEILIRDPGNQNALLSRAKVSIQQGDPNQGLTDIDAAIEVNPDNSAAHLMRAQLLQGTGYLEEALASYSKVKDDEGDIGRIARQNIGIIEQQLK